MTRSTNSVPERADETEDELIKLLNTFGLTGNESRIYLALLKTNPATGYEISQMTNVPRSAIYHVLQRLESQNLVNSVDERPRHFVPLPAEALLSQYSHKLDRDLAELRASLAELIPGDQTLDMWFLKGYEEMILKAQELLSKAREKIYLSLLKTEYLALELEIAAAIERGVEVTIFSYTRLPEINAQVVSYELDEGQFRAAWDPSIIVVTDHRTAIMGGQSAQRPIR